MGAFNDQSRYGRSEMTRNSSLYLLLIAVLLGTVHPALAETRDASVKRAEALTAKRPQQSSQAAALDWLRQSEAAMARVERIPLAFPKEQWAHWMVQSYLDLERPQEAVAFAVRFQEHFDMAFVRNAIRYIAYQLASQGGFNKAHEIGKLLYTGLAANPHVRQHDVYVDLLIDLAALEARAGDFPRALRTAKMIPANGNSHWAKARSDAFGFVALGYAQAGDTNGLQQIEREYAPRENDWLQAGRLVLATELAKAGAFAEAQQLAETLPATLRDAFVAGEAVELAAAGKLVEAKMAITKLPRLEQRQPAWLRATVAVAFKQGAAAATDFAGGNDEVESVSAEQVIARTAAWMGQVYEPDSSNPFWQRAESGFSPDLSEIERQRCVYKALPKRQVRPGGIDPFSPPDFITIDDQEFRATFAHAQELVAESWDAASLAEGLKPLHGSVATEEFQQQVNLYTALATLATVAGDKKQAAAFAGSAAAAAERVDFRSCGPQTRIFLPTLALSGRSDLAVQFLRRLVAADTHERFPASKVAHSLVVAGEEKRVDELLSIVGNDPDRAAVCLGATRGCIAMTQPTDELPLVRDEWDLIAKLAIKGDEYFPRSEWADQRTGYRDSLGHGHPLWLEPRTWPDVFQRTVRPIAPSAQGAK